MVGPPRLGAGVARRVAPKWVVRIDRTLRVPQRPRQQRGPAAGRVPLGRRRATAGTDQPVRRCRRVRPNLLALQHRYRVDRVVGVRAAQDRGAAVRLSGGVDARLFAGDVARVAAGLRRRARPLRVDQAAARRQRERDGGLDRGGSARRASNRSSRQAGRGQRRRDPRARDRRESTVGGNVHRSLRRRATRDVEPHRRRATAPTRRRVVLPEHRGEPRYRRRGRRPRGG